MEVLGLLKPSLQDFKHDLTSMGDKCDCLMVSTFFGTTLLGNWDEDWPFPVNLIHCFLQTFYTPRCRLFCFYKNTGSSLVSINKPALECNSYFIYGQPYKWLSAAAKSLQSCPTLCHPRDGSPPGSSVPGILQARTGLGCLKHVEKSQLKSSTLLTHSFIWANIFFQMICKE